MKSRVLQQDRSDLIALNRALSPQERIAAFYRHSLLLSQLSLVRKEGKQKDISSSRRIPPLSEK